MLFASQNGQERPVEPSIEADVQGLACELGPAVDGVFAPQALPQAMGAFVTAGAQGACGGRRSQQQEQHLPTTMYGLGQYTPASPVATQPPVIVRPPPTPKPTTFNVTRAFFPQPPADQATFPFPIAPDGGAATLPAASGQILPAGAITAFNSKTGLWRVAIPAGTSIQAQSSLAGFFGLGAAAFTEVASQPAPPATATQTTENDFEKKTGTVPFFKKPLFWVAVGGGAAVIGGGAWLIRRRKSAAY